MAFSSIGRTDFVCVEYHTAVAEICSIRFAKYIQFYIHKHTGVEGEAPASSEETTKARICEANNKEKRPRVEMLGY